MENLSKEELINLIKKLEKENKELKEKIYGKVEKKEVKENNNEKVNISNEEKVKLFMELFKGRTDVYAKRWESKERTGYTPVCKNEFKDRCGKPKVKCNNCIYRELVPLTKEIVLEHLLGKKSIGIYPLLPGDLCNFLAIDFDKENYKVDVPAFWLVCDKFNIPIYVEKSRSGNGIHIWIFFEEEMPAKLARKMGNILLSKTMEIASIDLKSYDRLFPNQDTMPEGGFGNLIALPFQGKRAKEGNTIFVDKNFEPEKNQTEILLNIKKMTKEDIYSFVERYKEDDYEEPEQENIAEDDEIPKKGKIKDIIFQNDIECIFDNMIYIKKSKLLPNEISYLKRLASFANPEFYRKQRAKQAIYYKTTPRIIASFEEDDKYLIIPRGCIQSIEEVCNKSNVNLIIKDTREKGSKIEYKFLGNLWKEQEKVKNQLLEYETGILEAPPSFGKTVLAINIISELKTNTLILVNRNTLLEQWKEKLTEFLNVNKENIGQLGANKNTLNGKLDIVSFQSLARIEEIEDLEEIVSGYGLVIVDECHHVAATTFERVLKAVRSKYVYGLTATPKRKDGCHKITYMQCGNIRVRVSDKELNKSREMERVVVVRKTGYRYDIGFENNNALQEILNDMCNNIFRNDLIIDDIKKCVQEGGNPIVLTERREHLEILKEKLEDLKVTVVIYKGAMRKKEKEKIKESIEEADKNGKQRIIIATSQIIGEGFDDKKLDTLFLTMPVAAKERIVQYVGRLHRANEGKNKVVVYDYLDDMNLLKSMFKKREKAYKSIGYEIAV